MYPSVLAENKDFEGKKNYELANHLGNVLAVISDRKKGMGNTSGNYAYFDAVTISATDYYPFGMAMPGRSFNTEGYRFGFNGKENDSEWAKQDYGMRISDPRIGRFLSIDPLAIKYPMLTPYQFASNTPIMAIDLDGLEMYYAANGTYLGKSGKSIEIRVITNEKVAATAKKNLTHSNWNHDWLGSFSQKAYDNPNQAALEWAYENGSKSDMSAISYSEEPYKEKLFEFGAMIGSLDTKDGAQKPIILYTIGTTVGGEYGDEGQVDVPKSETLPGWKREHGIHSHTGPEGTSSSQDSDEEFSDRNGNFGLKGDKELAKSQKMKLYLVTPRGKLKMYDPVTEKATEIYSGVPRRKFKVEEMKTKFTDTRGVIRSHYEIIYDKIKAPLIFKPDKEQKH